MNTAYWLAIVWGVLAYLALMIMGDESKALVILLTIASALSALLGVAIEYRLL